MANLTKVTLVNGTPNDSGDVSTVDALLAVASTSAKQDTGNASLATLAGAVSDGKLLVTASIDPESVNSNGLATPANSSPVVAADGYSQYETIAASQTDQVMGTSGASGDYLAGVLIVPGTSAAGAVSIKDGSGSSISIFAGGGTTALPTLAPFMVPLGIFSTGGAWKITTGSNVTAIGIGKFS